MKPLITIIVFNILFLTFTYSQNSLDCVLIEIEKNNTTLLALKKHTEAEKIGNKTGIFLNNPEIGLNYLWGAPSDLGNRMDISVTQTFDFPTTYVYKKQIANLKNEQTNLEFKKELIHIKTMTRLICIDLVYYNKLIDQYSVRLHHAKTIAQSFTAKFEAGETNILEYNKAHLNFSSVKNEIERSTLERDALLIELSGLNGGIPVEFNDSMYQMQAIPEDFESWYMKAEENNPILLWLKQEVDITLNEQKLNRALGLPKFQAGYMSETVTDEQFQGVTLGLSIPLWENKNKVKYSKAKKFATESLKEDRKIHFYNELKSLHLKSIGLLKITNDYRESIKSFEHSELLIKALDAGEIDLIEYMLELSVYYESLNKLLESERELNKTIANLIMFL